jgi:hypothetical protein
MMPPITSLTLLALYPHSFFNLQHNPPYAFVTSRPDSGYADANVLAARKLSAISSKPTVIGTHITKNLAWLCYRSW